MLHCSAIPHLPNEQAVTISSLRIAGNRNELVNIPHFDATKVKRWAVVFAAATFDSRARTTHAEKAGDS
jgi:hypothetical protein